MQHNIHLLSLAYDLEALATGLLAARQCLLHGRSPTAAEIRLILRIPRWLNARRSKGRAKIICKLRANGMLAPDSGLRSGLIPQRNKISLLLNTDSGATRAAANNCAGQMQAKSKYGCLTRRVYYCWVARARRARLPGFEPNYFFWLTQQGLPPLHSAETQGTRWRLAQSLTHTTVIHY